MWMSERPAEALASASWRHGPVEGEVVGSERDEGGPALTVGQVDEDALELGRGGADLAGGCR